MKSNPQRIAMNFGKYQILTGTAYNVTNVVEVP